MTHTDTSSGGAAVSSFGERLAWTESKLARNGLGVAFGVLALVLVGMQWVVSRADHTEAQKASLDGAVGLYALIGVAGVIVSLVITWVLSSVLSRDLDYYSQAHRGGEHG